MTSSTLHITRPKSYRTLIYTLLIFVAIVGSGELFLRIPLVEEALKWKNIPLWRQTGYDAGDEQIVHFLALQDENWLPDCIIIGNSFAQTGINPEIFSKAFREQTGRSIDCFNFGADASSASSSAIFATLAARTSRLSLIIWGTQANQFFQSNASHRAEDLFSDLPFIAYITGQFNTEGWIQENIRTVTFLKKIAHTIFPVDQSAQATRKDTIRPSVSRRIEKGYAPLSFYRDDSTLFMTEVENLFHDNEANLKDYEAFYRLIALSQSENIDLIMVEMPISQPPEFIQAKVNDVADLAREQSVPFLSTVGLPDFSPGAYADRSHLHISGSYLFSDWLGTQIGQAYAQDLLTDVNNPIWFPEFDEWQEPDYNTTLGFSDASYQDYQSARKTIDLLPDDAIVLNPSPTELDRQFIQTSLGFLIDWKERVTIDQRDHLFDLMTVFEMMRYESDLKLNPPQSEKLDLWRESGDPDDLNELGIEYILCRREFANPDIQHCPSQLADSSNYSVVAEWDYEPMYERYTLYRVSEQE